MSDNFMQPRGPQITQASSTGLSMVSRVTIYDLNDQSLLLIIRSENLFEE